ncbi:MULTISPECIES: hypothetical protein [unclassified Bradyrhizobium]|uniref:hypothetical protein n=1 Tax=unclassified Bradyrhizobium TaxID=2631580 RepID=UPI0028E8D1B3|nr:MULTISPECIES: hypothetical protein [unclassified Bradyrhizobium]
MAISILFVMAFITGLCFRQVMRFQEGLAELGRNMAIAENSKDSASSYQNSITPPWLMNVWLSLAAALLGSAGTAAYLSGIGTAALVVLLFLAGMLASGLTSRALSRPHFETYCRLALRSLLQRQADYRRDGDVIRADAAQHLTWLLTVLVGPSFKA